VRAGAADRLGGVRRPPRRSALLARPQLGRVRRNGGRVARAVWRSRACAGGWLRPGGARDRRGLGAGGRQLDRCFDLTTPGYSEITTIRDSVISWTANFGPSRVLPDSLTPPEGICSAR